MWVPPRFNGLRRARGNPAGGRHGPSRDRGRHSSAGDRSLSIYRRCSRPCRLLPGAPVGTGLAGTSPALVDRQRWRSFSLELPSFAAVLVGRLVGPRATQRAKGHVRPGTRVICGVRSRSAPLHLAPTVRPPASLETAQVVASLSQRATLAPARSSPTFWAAGPFSRPPGSRRPLLFPYLHLCAP